MKLRVSVPASTANLGPGFDCLGLALDLVNTFTFEMREGGSGWRLNLNGEGADKLPRNERNLVVQAALHVFSLQGFKPRGEIRLDADVRIPLASGLGSSASAVVAGMAAANTLMGDPLPREALFEQMVHSEGHPDNVAPAFLGGLTVAFYSEGSDGMLPELLWRQYQPHPELRVVILYPHYEVPTAKARAILPDLVDRRGAAQNMARLPFLIDALVDGHFDRLHFLMDDHLHQPYRKSLISHFDDIVEAGESAGAKAVALSGSGPSMAAFCDRREGLEEQVAAAMHAVVADRGIEATTFILAPHDGTKIEVLD
ncbi:MAG: homoserine kinase [Candidatus Sumerlaeia bacterium]